MSTPILNKTDDPIKTDSLTPDSPLLTFINSKISQGRIYCQECLKAKGELIAVRMNFEGDRAVFSHDDCILNPQIPKPSVTEIKPFEVRDGLVYVPVTEEGWTYDPPRKVGDRCAIVSKYYHEWLFSKSQAKSHSYKIDAAYQSATEWDSHSTLIVEKIDGDRAKVKSQSGKTRVVPLKVLWTLEKA